jgi:hypothetical protein
LSSRRGQLFSCDLIAAVALFTIALGTIVLAWDFGKVRMGEAGFSRELERKAYMVSDQLVKTPGSPLNWESDPGSPNITGIGLAQEDRVLSEAKVASLSRVDARLLREALGLGASRCYIALRTVEGAYAGRAGEEPAGGFSASATRIVSYLNRTAYLEVTVWGRRDEGGIIL